MQWCDDDRGAGIRRPLLKESRESACCRQRCVRRTAEAWTWNVSSFIHFNMRWRKTTFCLTVQVSFCTLSVMWAITQRVRLISEKAAKLHVFGCFIRSVRTGSSWRFVFSLNIPVLSGGRRSWNYIYTWNGNQTQLQCFCRVVGGLKELQLFPADWILALDNDESTAGLVLSRGTTT